MKIFLSILLLHFFIPADEVQKPNVTEEEKQMILERHAHWRKIVGLPALTWSDEMAELADDWARTLKKKGCQMSHRPNNNYGENIFWGTVGHYTAADAVDAWASEKADYDYASNSCNPGKVCGHYTQIVWKNTTEVGCAKIVCNGNVVWVCNYNPPGNYIGQKPY